MNLETRNEARLTRQQPAAGRPQPVRVGVAGRFKTTADRRRTKVRRPAVVLRRSLIMILLRLCLEAQPSVAGIPVRSHRRNVR